MSAISNKLVKDDLYEVCLSEFGKFPTDHDGVVRVLTVPKKGSFTFQVEIVSGLEYYQNSEFHGALFDVHLGSPFHLSMRPLMTEENYSIELSFDSLMNQETE